MQVPELTISISPADGSRVSYNTGHNLITITYTSDISLIYEEIRVTKGIDNFGIGYGVRVHRDGGSIEANVPHVCSFEVNSTNFSEGDGLYTVSLYVKNSTDGTWNEVHFFITVDNEAFITADPAELVTTTHQPIPADSLAEFTTEEEEKVVVIKDKDLMVIDA